MGPPSVLLVVTTHLIILFSRIQRGYRGRRVHGELLREGQPGHRGVQAGRRRAHPQGLHEVQLAVRLVLLGNEHAIYKFNWRTNC